jgi:uncharacterized protein YrrD
MESSPTIHKWSDIAGLAAVAIDTGKKVGTIDDFLFDPQSGIIHAFQVKTGLFGHHLLPTSTVNGLGEHAVTFSNEDALLKESDKGLATYPFGKELQNYRVLSQGGTLVGTIRNILIEISSPGNIQIAALELTGGLRERLTGHYPTLAADKIMHYGHDVVVISDTVAQSLEEQQ